MLKVPDYDSYAFNATNLSLKIIDNSTYFLLPQSIILNIKKTIFFYFLNYCLILVFTILSSKQHQQQTFR